MANILIWYTYILLQISEPEAGQGPIQSATKNFKDEIHGLSLKEGDKILRKVKLLRVPWAMIVLVHVRSNFKQRNIILQGRFRHPNKYFLSKLLQTFLTR